MLGLNRLIVGAGQELVGTLACGCLCAGAQRSSLDCFCHSSTWRCMYAGAQSKVFRLGDKAQGRLGEKQYGKVPEKWPSPDAIRRPARCGCGQQPAGAQEAVCLKRYC
jgi:hypothetical protein